LFGSHLFLLFHFHSSIGEGFMKSATKNARRRIDPVTNLWRFGDERDDAARSAEAGPDSAEFIDPDSDFEDGDLAGEELPCTDGDDSRWEAFVPDEDERDPEPEPGDFWTAEG
jgi:hypothetical protein